MTKFVFTITATVEEADADAAENLVLADLKRTKLLTDAQIEEIDEEAYDMTDAQIIADFEETILLGVIEDYGPDDQIAKREAFNNYTDALCKDGTITGWQYENIDNPY